MIDFADREKKRVDRENRIVWGVLDKLQEGAEFKSPTLNRIDKFMTHPIVIWLAGGLAGFTAGWMVFAA